MKQDPTINDVLEAVQTFSTHTDTQFAEMRSEIGKMRSEMVTKEYLDNKLADLRGVDPQRRSQSARVD